MDSMGKQSKKRSVSCPGEKAADSGGGPLAEKKSGICRQLEGKKFRMGNLLGGKSPKRGTRRSLLGSRLFAKGGSGEVAEGHFLLSRGSQDRGTRSTVAQLDNRQPLSDREKVFREKGRGHFFKRGASGEWRGIENNPKPLY